MMTTARWALVPRGGGVVLGNSSGGWDDACDPGPDDGKLIFFSRAGDWLSITLFVMFFALTLVSVAACCSACGGFGPTVRFMLRCGTRRCCDAVFSCGGSGSGGGSGKSAAAAAGGTAAVGPPRGHRYPRMDPSAPRPLLRVLALAAGGMAAFRAAQSAVNIDVICEAPLADNPQWLQAAAIMVFPRIATACLLVFYTAVIYMWQEAVIILEVDTNARFHKRVLQLMLVTELMFVVALCVAMAWADPLMVTDVDEVKDVVLYVGYVTLLAYYAFVLVRTLANISRANGGTCTMVGSTCGRCLSFSWRRMSVRAAPVDALTQIIGEAADSKLWSIALVSVIVAFGVLVRFVKALLTALQIARLHTILPSHNGETWMGVAWVLYYLFGEIMPIVVVLALTMRASLACCTPANRRWWCSLCCSRSRRAGSRTRPSDATGDAATTIADALLTRASVGDSFASGGTGASYANTGDVYGMYRDASRELVLGYDVMAEVP